MSATRKERRGSGRKSISSRTEADRSEVLVDDHADGEENDVVAPLCTCGHGNHGNHGQTKKSGAARNGRGHAGSNHPPASSRAGPSWLESSFVHLLAPPSHMKPGSSSTFSNFDVQTHPCHGYLESHQHLSRLLSAATDPNSTVSLCNECIDRVVAALEADTERLFTETAAYQEAAKVSKQRARTLDTLTSGFADQPSINEHKRDEEDGTHYAQNTSQQNTRDAYVSEILMLRNEVEAREAELANLDQVHGEQLRIKEQIDLMEEQMGEDLNVLEWRSQTFDSSLQLLTEECSRMNEEIDQLAHVNLPQALFDLQVDDRGLRYPLINKLRLGFLPKGDLSSKEIQVAWSLATQLLLFVGTLLDFKSKAWKLVPLTDCAKLIYKKEIYNLVPGNCRGLLAFNALLDQVVRHAKTKATSMPPPPFQTSPTSIGSINLTTLSQADNATWSKVIHCMTSNLSWLSQCSAELTAQFLGTVVKCVR